MPDDATAAEGGIPRRGFLKLTALGVSGVGVTAATGCSIFTGRGPSSTVGEVDFNTALHIPPLADSVVSDGHRVFDLVAQAGQTQIVPQGETETWGINGSFLGPTLRVTQGERVRVNIRNNLEVATTLHWHGMALPAVADGGPHSMIEPGQEDSPSWEVTQPAATLWYHPHPHGETEVHVYRGLGGMFILDDDVESQLDLPREYGVDDIPLIVQDKTFDDEGQLVETNRVDNGMLGETILVNGTAGAYLDIGAQRTRLRILNASTARSYSFGLSDERSFTMIASDGGLLSEPISLEQIMLTPGERADIVVEMEAGETVVLRSYPQDLGVSSRVAARTGADAELDILQLQAASSVQDSPALPTSLSIEPDLDAADAEQTRSFELSDNRINGQPMDMERVDEIIAAGATEIWEVENTHSQPHNFHIHDVQFQILDIDGEAPPAHLAGWKDTIYTPPSVRFRLIMRFSEYSDPQIPYMYHCHLLWHEDEGMMGQFLLVDEADRAAADNFEAVDTHQHH